MFKNAISASWGQCSTFQPQLLDKNQIKDSGSRQEKHPLNSRIYHAVKPSLKSGIDTRKGKQEGLLFVCFCAWRCRCGRGQNVSAVSHYSCACARLQHFYHSPPPPPPQHITSFTFMWRGRLQQQLHQKHQQTVVLESACQAPEGNNSTLCSGATLCSPIRSIEADRREIGTFACSED